MIFQYSLLSSFSLLPNLLRLAQLQLSQFQTLNMNTANKSTCSQCHKLIADKAMKAHLRSHSQTGFNGVTPNADGVWICQESGCTYSTAAGRESFKKHYQRMHKAAGRSATPVAATPAPAVAARPSAPALPTSSLRLSPPPTAPVAPQSDISIDPELVGISQAL